MPWERLRPTGQRPRVPWGRRLLLLVGVALAHLAARRWGARLQRKDLAVRVDQPAPALLDAEPTPLAVLRPRRPNGEAPPDLDDGALGMTPETQRTSDDDAAPSRVLPTEADVRAEDLEQDRRAPEPTEAPSREQRIRDAAYANYLRRGAMPGLALDDWVEAEQQVDDPRPPAP